MCQCFFCHDGHPHFSVTEGSLHGKAAKKGAAPLETCRSFNTESLCKALKTTNNRVKKDPCGTFSLLLPLSLLETGGDAAGDGGDFLLVLVFGVLTSGPFSSCHHVKHLKRLGAEKRTLKLKSQLDS